MLFTSYLVKWIGLPFLLRISFHSICVFLYPHFIVKLLMLYPISSEQNQPSFLGCSVSNTVPQWNASTRSRAEDDAWHECAARVPSCAPHALNAWQGHGTTGDVWASLESCLAPTSSTQRCFWLFQQFNTFSSPPAKLHRNPMAYARWHVWIQVHWHFIAGVLSV